MGDPIQKFSVCHSPQPTLRLSDLERIASRPTVENNKSDIWLLCSLSLPFYLLFLWKTPPCRRFLFKGYRRHTAHLKNRDKWCAKVPDRSSCSIPTLPTLVLLEVPGVEHRSPEDLGFAVTARSSALGFPLRRHSQLREHRWQAGFPSTSLSWRWACTEHLPCRISVWCSHHHRSEPVLSVPSSSEPQCSLCPFKGFSPFLKCQQITVECWLNNRQR